MVIKMLPSKKLNTGSPRPSGRGVDELRTVTIETGVNAYAEGSCLISFGNTKVLCTASVEEKVPPFLRGKKQGWVTAEYGMLPRSTHNRIDREASRGKQSGRTQEIQRLIGRSLRTITNLDKLGERTIWLDCDVLQADGGTRTAAITGAYVALSIACKRLLTAEKIAEFPLADHVAAISCGVTAAGAVLDLDYDEDSAAIADGNFVLTGKGHIIEVQTTAEATPIEKDTFYALLSLAEKGVLDLIQLQKQAIEKA